MKLTNLATLASLVFFSGSLFAVERIHVKGTVFAAAVNQELQQIQLKLNNHKVQSSYLKLMGFQIPFTIDRVVIDIDCGILCPDLGDGHFYVNEVTLKSQRFTFSGSHFNWLVEFEDNGREIKGYHNKFGDNWMPDFNMSRNRVATNALPKVTGGQLAMTFGASRLDADITSTGGCKLAGIDFCNKLFKTDRRIQKAVEKAADTLLKSARAQSAMTYGLTRILQRQGISGPFTRAYVSGNDLILEKP